MTFSILKIQWLNVFHLSEEIKLQNHLGNREVVQSLLIFCWFSCSYAFSSWILITIKKENIKKHDLITYIWIKLL